MEIELARLSDRETAVEADVAMRDEPPGAPGELALEGIRFPAPVRFRGTLRRDGLEIIVSGALSGALAVACCRCLRSFERPVDLSFQSRHVQSRHVQSSAASTASDAEGTRLEARDLDVSFLPAGATHLDLGEVAREQVLLDLPHRILCDAACRGLCGQCGTDLNRSDCDCPETEQDIDPRLAALAELKRRLGGPSSS